VDPRHQLAALANPECAAAMARYFQVRPGGYGEGDVFLGIRLSDLRTVAKPYVRQPYDPDLWIPLLRSPVHEHRQLALLIMASRATRGAGHEQERVYDDYLSNTTQVNNWDLVDVSCGPIVGGFLQDRDRSPLYELAASPLMWERRIAMVGSQHFLKAGETDDLFALAERLLTDRHDLMHKAVGWSLREAGKRVSRDALRAFLDRHAAEMPRTALRYAIEHFDSTGRQHYLGLRAQRAG
jgi:3-methyladenine DNA glycosylase AlkD